MSSITSLLTIDYLQSLFAAYGIPEEVLSDNGPQLVSAMFTDFLKGNRIKHTRVPAFHPASNSAAERSVQILKQSDDFTQARIGKFLDYVLQYTSDCNSKYTSRAVLKVSNHVSSFFSLPVYNRLFIHLQRICTSDKDYATQSAALFRRFRERLHRGLDKRFPGQIQEHGQDECLSRKNIKKTIKVLYTYIVRKHCPILSSDPS